MYGGIICSIMLYVVIGRWI